MTFWHQIRSYEIINLGLRSSTASAAAPPAGLCPATAAAAKFRPTQTKGGCDKNRNSSSIKLFLHHHITQNPDRSLSEDFFGGLASSRIHLSEAWDVFFLTSIRLNSLQWPPLMSSGALLSSFLLFQRDFSCSHLSDLSVKTNQAWKMGTSSIGVVFLHAQWGNSLFSTHNHAWFLTVGENESSCLFSPAPLTTGFFSRRGDGGPSSLVLQSAWRCWETLVPAGASAGVWTHQARRQHLSLGCVCGECVCVSTKKNH